MGIEATSHPGIAFHQNVSWLLNVFVLTWAGWIAGWLAWRHEPHKKTKQGDGNLVLKSEKMLLNDVSLYIYCYNKAFEAVQYVKAELNCFALLYGEGDDYGDKADKFSMERTIF